MPLCLREMSKSEHKRIGAFGLVEETLKEEKDTDATLTEMAESVINQKAEAAE